jgi:ppGpp synthetase/RelA/SpoT-type nucleotidyltranferase
MSAAIPMIHDSQREGVYVSIPAIDAFYDEYERTLKDFRDVIISELKRFRFQIGRERIHVHFTSRIKRRGSVQRALQQSYAREGLRPPLHLELSDVQRRVPDLVGVRIVTRYPDLVAPLTLNVLNSDALRLADHAYGQNLKWFRWSPFGLEEVHVELLTDSGTKLHIPIVERNSGYSSVHMLVQMNAKTQLNDHGLVAEIQVRSVLEDVWAESEHQAYESRMGKGEASQRGDVHAVSASYKGIRDLLFLADRRIGELRQQFGQRQRYNDWKSYKLRDDLLARVEHSHELVELLGGAYAALVQLWATGISPPGGDVQPRAVDHIRTLHNQATLLCQWLLKRPNAFKSLGGEGNTVRLDLFAEVAYLLFQAGDRAMASWVYNFICSVDPSHFFGAYRQAHLAFEEGDIATAITLQQRACTEFKVQEKRLRQRFPELPKATELWNALLFYRYQAYERQKEWDIELSYPTRQQLLEAGEELLRVARSELRRESELFARAVNGVVWLMTDTDKPDWNAIEGLIVEAQLTDVAEDRGWRAAAYLDTAAEVRRRQGRLADALKFSLEAVQVARRFPETDPWARERITKRFEAICGEWAEGMAEAHVSDVEAP